jgi:hypothetical protein
VRPLHLVFSLGVPLALFACDGRPPGPLESDRGRVLYWEITDAALVFTMCTDAATWRSDFGNPQAAVGGGISYRLAEDGETAEAVTCETTDPDTCMPLTPRRVFGVEDSTLRFEAEPRRVPSFGLDCEREIRREFEYTDRGDTLDVAIRTRHDLVGTSTACDALDEVFIGLGSDTNTFGVRDCVVTFDAEAKFLGSF